MHFPKKNYNESSLALSFISFFSGFIISNYQIIWHRWLVSRHIFLSFINTNFALALFVVGLFLGYFIGEQLSLMLNRSLLIFIFVLIELGIMLFALFTVMIFYNWLPKDHWVFSSGLCLLLFLVLLLPVIAMAASTSVLAGTFAKRRINTLQHSHFAHLAGASLGLLASPFVHSQIIGLENTIYLGAFLNLSCAVIAIVHYYLTYLKNETIEVSVYKKNKRIFKRFLGFVYLH